jgi:hypothetical protein
MVSSDLAKRLETARRDLSNVRNMPRFAQISNNKSLTDLFSDAVNLATTWLVRVERARRDALDDPTLAPLVVFTEKIVAIADQGTAQGETIVDALRKATSGFRPAIPELIYALLESSGITRLADEDFPAKRDEALREILAKRDEALREVEAAATGANADVRKTVKESADELEAVKTAARKISVQGAQDEFATAAKILSKRAAAWTATTIGLFVMLVGVLCRFLFHPPPLIAAIAGALMPQPSQVALPVSVPLLVAASAYYTSIRLALIGVLGVALAFSLRMTRAYFHMIEHNQHKSRVTNSIEAFVASVRTDEQRDLVLGKLVDSVTQFGESGILGKESETSSLPSVMFEAVTKNVGKS